MLAESLTVTAPAPQAAAPAAPPPAKPGFFDHLLSELNPLQYVPVVGTIYRAVTGDTIPEDARFAGSLVVSGLTGGPVGIALNVGTTVLERVLGIDQEKIGGDILAGLGIGGGHSAKQQAAASPTSPTTPTVSAVAASQGATGWSAAQLAAYGVTKGADGALIRGSISGADVLNGLELAEVASPAATAATQAPAVALAQSPSKSSVRATTAASS